MRTLIVQELVSADGYAADPDGGLDFFGSVADYDDIDRDSLAVLDRVDLILLGRTTYDLFVQYWPTSDEPVTEAVNSTPKVVCSSSLQHAPWGRFADAAIAPDAVAAVTERKAEDGGDIMVWGSLTIARTLLRAGLVDELQLRVCPVLLGSGRSFVPEELRGRALEVSHTKTYPTGLVDTHYRLGTP